MSRKHPKARRATALTLLTSTFLVFAAAIALALHTTPASASGNYDPPVILSSRRPLPGDPNTPDEGSGGGTVLHSTSPSTSPVRALFDWVKGFAHHYFYPSR